MIFKDGNTIINMARVDAIKDLTERVQETCCSSGRIARHKIPDNCTFTVIKVIISSSIIELCGGVADSFLYSYEMYLASQLCQS